LDELVRIPHEIVGDDAERALRDPFAAQLGLGIQSDDESCRHQARSAGPAPASAAARDRGKAWSTAMIEARSGRCAKLTRYRARDGSVRGKRGAPPGST